MPSRSRWFRTTVCPCIQAIPSSVPIRRHRAACGRAAEARGRQVPTHGVRAQSARTRYGRDGQHVCRPQGHPAPGACMQRARQPTEAIDSRSVRPSPTRLRLLAGGRRAGWSARRAETPPTRSGTQNFRRPPWRRSFQDQGPSRMSGRRERRRSSRRERPCR